MLLAVMLRLSVSSRPAAHATPEWLALIGRASLFVLRYFFIPHKQLSALAFVGNVF